MMWDHVLRRIHAVVQADAFLHSIYGDTMRVAGTSEHIVPALEWSLISDAENELWAPCLIQFDQWHTDLATVANSERRLRSLFHQETPVMYGDILMWAQYEDGSVLASPDRHGFSGRAVRFRFTPLRERYSKPST